ncbi:MAG: APC family permease, partial [Gemmatimonadota bacterium]
AAVPALLAALAYAVLASAMPRAGGSYIYASRGLHPYLGFVASFAQWFGLSIAIGVVSYVTIPFARDVVAALGWAGTAALLDTGPVRVGLALALLWGAVWINVRGLAVYQRILVPLMLVMFVLGAIVIVAGFLHDQGDFAAGLMAREGVPVPELPDPGFNWWTFLAASAVLFSSFIGFDSIAQAGGEARNPSRTLPLAIGIAIVTVGSFYLLFTAAVYNTVPWSFIAERARTQDLTAPGLLGYVLSPGWTILIVAGAAIALINDLPAMFLVMCLTVITLPRRNPALEREVTVLRNRRLRTGLAGAGVLLLLLFLGVHTIKDLTADVTAWYFRSTPLWLGVMALASAIFLREWRGLQVETGGQARRVFETLPPE